MREIKYIVLHTTASPQNQPVKEILNYWRNVNGWKSPGYHFLIKADGTYEQLLDISKPSNGVAGYSDHSIHISYIGGANGVDNRTQGQIGTQIFLVKKYMTMFPNAEVKGHRDFPGVTKTCPNFDVSEWMRFAGLK